MITWFGAGLSVFAAILSVFAARWREPELGRFCIVLAAFGLVIVILN